jgi:hypothetical protein
MWLWNKEGIAKEMRMQTATVELVAWRSESPRCEEELIN